MNRNHHISRLWQWLLAVCMVCSLSGCRETLEHLFSEPIEVGDAVSFTSSMQGSVTGFTRGVENRQKITEDYLFTITMMTDEEKVVGTGRYRTTSDDIGSLAAEDTLYWPSTTVPYGFKATAGSEKLEADQTTKAKWLLQDRLAGEAEAGDKKYLTAKDWKKYNEGVGLTSNENYKKVPLFMAHQRALISIILKAGEGVSSKALSYSAAQKDIVTHIYSYGDTEPLAIQPLASGDKIDDDSTTRYDAIVEPYIYKATDLVTKISLSGQNYSFYAQNDGKFVDDPSRYNLQAGQHLVITVTLGRKSREVYMTAYIEDWTEEVTTSICDDYGNAGEPIKIPDLKTLKAFLADENDNKPGNVGLVTDNIDLGEDWNNIEYELKATLNLGGKTLISNHRFLKSLAATATLQNGSIQIGGSVDAAVAEENHGVIESVQVTTGGAAAVATRAGVVISNSGSISQCRSALKVQGGTAEYVGGIAATSLSTSTKQAIIDGCTVTSSVKGGSYGGGIVGQASGTVTNNTFTYGITLSQDAATHKNIVGATDGSLTASGNAWPTVDGNFEMKNAETNLYTGIIDSEADFSKTVAAESNRYRLADDVTITQTVGSVGYELDGNDKQLTTSAQVFNAITGKVHDLTVYVSKSLVTDQDQTTATDAIAPLAFEVHGEKAAIEHVHVKMADGTKIQASNPAGLVVWVWDGATVSGCEATVNLFANVAKGITQGRKFAGGLVSTVSRGKVTQCILHSASTFAGTASSILFYGGIVGGIEKKEGFNDAPELTITDCTSFMKMAKDNQHGGILGNAMQAQTLATKDCQGNWWDADCNGVGYCDGYSVEAVIGKRNAITPTEK